MILTSTGTGCLDPTLTTSRYCNTSSNLACIPNGKSPTSSRTNQPFVSVSNHPALLVKAHVNEPFSSPNNS
ncbi:MAG: hypothetical protein QX199_02140, partial [Methylococcaceae bacterium]